MNTKLHTILIETANAVRANRQLFENGVEVINLFTSDKMPSSLWRFMVDQIENTTIRIEQDNRVWLWENEEVEILVVWDKVSTEIRIRNKRLITTE